MTLDFLIETAFREGSGISRSYAKRHPRMHELIEQAPHIPHVSATDVAEMTHLGERIADRAFLNLPKSLQRIAAMWPSLTKDERIAALQKLSKTLSDNTHARRGVRRCSSVSEDAFCAEAFPASYGSWTHGKIQPNCLGLAQMLIGFARKTQSPHFMVDIVVSNENYTLEVGYRYLKRLHDIVAPHYGTNRDMKHITRLLHTQLEKHRQTLAQVYASQRIHHYLVIKVGDEWWMVDPYLYTSRALEPHEYKELDRMHGKIASVPNRYYLNARAEHPFEALIVTKQAALAKYIPYLQQLHEPRSQWDFFSVVHPFIVDSMYDKESPKSAILASSLLNVNEYPAFHKLVKDPQDKEAEGVIYNALNRAYRQKRYRNRAMRRTAVLILATCHDLIQDMQEEYLLEGKSIVHQLEEYHESSYHLAVVTLNHLACALQVDAPELIRYSNAQWVIHDTLDSVEKCSDKRLKQIMATRKRRLNKAQPYQVLPRLRPYLQTKEM